MLDAQLLVLDLIRALRPLVDDLATRAPDLADQVRRAATSTALNLAEGVRRSGRDKKRAYRIAAAEAHEVRAALDVAVAWGFLGADDLAAAQALADRVGRVTYALAR